MFDAYRKGIDTIVGADGTERYWAAAVYSSIVLEQEGGQKEVIQWIKDTMASSPGILGWTLWNLDTMINEQVSVLNADVEFPPPPGLEKQNDPDVSDDSPSSNHSGLMKGVAAGLVGVGLVLITRKK